MIGDLRELIARRPFVPFTIHTVDGGAIRVPTLDHVHITPNANPVFVFYEDGRWNDIRPLMIRRLTVDQRDGGE